MWFNCVDLHSSSIDVIPAGRMTWHAHIVKSRVPTVGLWVSPLLQEYLTICWHDFTCLLSFDAFFLAAKKDLGGASVGRWMYHYTSLLKMYKKKFLYLHIRDRGRGH